jgi:hypothetical protein
VYLLQRTLLIEDLCCRITSGIEGTSGIEEKYTSRAEVHTNKDNK